MKAEQPQPKPQKKLTRKQQDFVEAYVATRNGAKAVALSYDVPPGQVASALAWNNLQKPAIIEAIEIERKTLKQALIDKGITEDYLANRVDTLLTAKDKDGADDYNSIDKGLKHATNIYGIVDQQEKGNSMTYNFIFNQEVKEKVNDINATIKAQLLKKKHETNQ